jgi:hypothetical protein
MRASPAILPRYELLEERRGRGRAKLGPGANLGYATPLEDGDAMAERGGILGIVSHHDRRKIELLQVRAQERPNLAARSNVEGVERFVEK